MELKEVQEFIKTNAEKPEVQNYIKGLITPDGVKTFIDSEEGQKLIQPKLDQYFTKGLETWKTNNLTKIVDEQVSKVVLEKYPKETEEQKRLHKLETDLMSEKSARQKAELFNKAMTEATKLGIPPDLVEYFIGQDEESTKAGIQKFNAVKTEWLKTEVDKVFKQYGRVPEKTTEATGLYTQAEVAKMSQQEVRKNRDKIHESMKHW